MTTQFQIERHSKFKEFPTELKDYCFSVEKFIRDVKKRADVTEVFYKENENEFLEGEALFKIQKELFFYSMKNKTLVRKTNELREGLEESYKNLVLVKDLKEDRFIDNKLKAVCTSYLEKFSFLIYYARKIEACLELGNKDSEEDVSIKNVFRKPI